MVRFMCSVGQTDVHAGSEQGRLSFEAQAVNLVPRTGEMGFRLSRPAVAGTGAYEPQSR